MSTTLPPVLTGRSITGDASHTVIDLAFSGPMQPGSGMIIVTDGAMQNVIDRGTGLPTLRIVGATETHEIPVSMASVDGNHVVIPADGLTAGHQYRVFIAPGVLLSNGLPFAGVTNTSLAFAPAAPPDTTPPTLLQMSLDNHALSAAQAANLTLTFSEAVTVDPNALSAPNVSISGLGSSDGGKTWHATVTAQAGLEAVTNNLVLDMHGVHDRANNQGSGSATVGFSVDAKGPTATSVVVSNTGPVLAPGATVTVTFSESVDLSASPNAIMAPHASLSNLHTTDNGTTWIATLIPQSGTSVTGNQLYVDMSQLHDMSGNAGSGQANAGSLYNVDTVGPGVKNISLDGALLSNSRTITLTITMQDKVSSFDPAALSTPNATVQDLHTTDGGVTWVATLKAVPGVSVGINTLGLDLSRVFDANGVAGSGVIQTPRAYGADTIAPTGTITLNGSQVSSASSVDVTIKFSESVQSFDPSIIHAPNAAVTALTSVDGLTWTAKLVPTTASGVVSGNAVSLDMTQVHDLAGNSGSGTVASSGTYSVDNTPPVSASAALSDSHVTTANGPTLTLTFSEVVSLPDTAITLPHAKLSNLHTTDSGKTWVATVLADGSGNASGNLASLDMTQVKDAFGNVGAGTTAIGSYDVQVTAPTATVSLTGSKLTQTGTIDLKIVFSQAVKAVDPSWISAPNAQVSALTSNDGGITWTGTLSSHANLTAIHNVLSLNMSNVQDYFGNQGSGSVGATSDYDIDTTSPTLLSMGLSNASVTPTAPATLTVTFSEPVKNLDLSDFSTPHAKLSSLTSSADGSTWTATLTADGGASASGNAVSLNLAGLTDLAGNPGVGTTAATTYDVVYPIIQGVTVALDHSTLSYGGDIVATLQFNSAVPQLNAAALTVQNASIAHMYTENGGLTWYVELSPASGAVVAPTNSFSIDLGQVADSSGTTGSGIVKSPNYAVDTTVSSYAESMTVYEDNGPSMTDFVTNQQTLYVEGSLSVALTEHQHVQLTIDGTAATVSTTGLVWVLNNQTVTLSPGKHALAVSVVDDAGHASAVMSKDLFIDTTAPNITTTSISGATATTPGTQDVAKALTLSFDKQMYWHTVTDDGSIYRDSDNAVMVADNADDKGSYAVFIDQRNLSADGKTLTLSAEDLHLVSGHTYTIVLPKALTDLAGNQPGGSSISLQGTGTYSDTQAPYALTEQVTDAPNTIGIGGTVHIAVRFNEAVAIKSGVTPYLPLNNGSQATFDHLSADARTVYFSYTTSAQDQLPTGNDYGWLQTTGTGNLVDVISDLSGNKLDSTHIQFTGLTNALAAITGSGITLDLTPPSTLPAPGLDASNDSGVKGDLITNSPWISGSKADAYATVKIYDVTSGSPQYVGSTYANQDGTWQYFAAHADGKYSFAATQLDDAGNESAMSPSFTLTVDTYAAGPDTLHLVDAYSASGLSSRIDTPTLAGSGMEAGSTITLYEGAEASTSSKVLGTAVADASGNWSITSSSLTEGDHPIWLTQTDISGNVGYSYGYTLTVDKTAPAQLGVPALDYSSDSGTFMTDHITNVTTPLITGSGAEGNATIELYEGGTLLGSGKSNGSGYWQIQLDASHSLTDGLHSITARQVDNAGNTGAFSNALSVTVDTTAPAQLSAPTLSPVSDSGAYNNDRITKVTQPIFTGSGAEANAFIELWDGTTKLATGTADNTGAWAVSPDNAHVLADGVHAISVRQVDAAGNSSIMSSTTSITIDTVAPTVTSSSNVLYPAKFALTFSEQVTHPSVSSLGYVYDAGGVVQLTLLVGENATWDDNVASGDHFVSTLSIPVSTSGSADIDLTGVQDIAGNAIATTAVHATFAYTGPASIDMLPAVLLY